MDSTSAVYLSLLSLLLLLQASFQQATTTKQVVEGLNTNIDILCDLDRELHPIYWRIQEHVYDQYGLPDIFTLRGHEAITLETVDRRMDGWRLQCFSVDHTRPEGLNPGMITILQVIVINNDTNIGTGGLLQPSLRGKITFHFQDLQIQIQQDTLILGWLYPPDPFSTACTESRFRIEVYTKSQINNAEMQSDLVPRSSFFVLSNQLHVSTMFLPDFFRISHQQIDCPRSDYFYNLRFNDTAPDIHVSEPTASFEIPERLLNNRSLQLVWPKDANTQCVCPPVQQFMASCACNIRHTSNMVTIANNTLTVSNITQEMGEGGVTFYFVFSTSGGCHGFCNLRYIVRKQRIIVAEGFPTSPALDLQTDNTFCFTIPDNPISAEVYEVELTDTTASQTRLSGDYNTSTCLTITSDLYPEVCGPFNLSVTAVNSVGREGTFQTINGMQERNLCRCYVEREKLAIRNIRPSSNSVEFHVSCTDEAILSIIQTDHTSASYRKSVTCNSTVTMGLSQPLMPSTNYTINGIFVDQQQTETLCQLDQFRTNGNGDNIFIISITVPIAGVLVLAVIIVVFALKFKHNKIYRKPEENELESSKPEENKLENSEPEENELENNKPEENELENSKPEENELENSNKPEDENSKPKESRPKESEPKPRQEGSKPKLALPEHMKPPHADSPFIPHMDKFGSQDGLLS